MGLEGGDCEIETRRVRQSHKADLRFSPDIILWSEHRLISNWEICSVTFVELAYVLKLLIWELDITENNICYLTMILWHRLLSFGIISLRGNRGNRKECLALEMCFIYFSNRLVILSLPLICPFLQSPKSLTFGQFSINPFNAMLFVISSHYQNF